MSNKSSSAEPVIDGSNVDNAKLLLKDLQTKFDQKFALLKPDLVGNKIQQEEALATGLVKIPKYVRQMRSENSIKHTAAISWRFS